MMEIGSSFLLQLIPVLIVIGILLAAYQRYKNTLELRIKGLKWLQALRLLASNIQKHRGLLTAVLAGERIFENEVKEAQHQVSRDIQNITELGPWVADNTEWQGITQHWAKLSGNVRDLPLESCFEQHCRLIKNILVFIDDLSVSHQLNAIYNQNIDTWRALLSLCEYIGQARALGTWASAEQSQNRTSTTEVANKKLAKLNNTILETLESPICKKVIDADSLQRILDYLIYVDKRVLMGSPPISSKAFFTKSTEVLDALFETMDEKLFEVHNFLKGSINS